MHATGISATNAGRLGRSPGGSELASHLGVSPDQILDARRADLSFHAPPLDARAGGGTDSASLGELLGEEDRQVQHTLDMTAVAPTGAGMLMPFGDHSHQIGRASCRERV